MNRGGKVMRVNVMEDKKQREQQKQKLEKFSSLQRSPIKKKEADEQKNEEIPNKKIFRSVKRRLSSTVISNPKEAGFDPKSFKKSNRTFTKIRPFGISGYTNIDILLNKNNKIL